MAETPSGPTIDPRLRDYLDAELRRAEVDFAGVSFPATRRATARAPLAAVVVVVVLVMLVAVGGPRTAMTSPSGTGSPPPTGSASPATTTIPQPSNATGFRGLPVDPSLTPVSLADPGVSTALSACGWRDQWSKVAGMARLPANEVHRFMLTNGREPELQTDEQVWAIQFQGGVLARTAILVDPMCVVIRGAPVIIAPYGNQGASFSPLPGFLWPQVALPPLLSSSTSASPAGISPSASNAPDTGPTLECGDSGVLFKASVLDGEPQLTGPDAAVAALRVYLGAGGYPGMPSDGWRTVTANEGSVTFLARGTPGWWFVTVAAGTGGAWQDSESGECRLAVSLPQTMTYAEWRLDPKHPVSSGATTVTVLATELACASGKPPGSRLQTPMVVETDTSVTITLLVRKQGNADCPSNSEFRVAVPLQAPLGSRSLLDGSTYPATVVAGQSTAVGLPVATLAPGETGGDARGGGILGGRVATGTACFWVSSPGLGVRTALVWPNGFSAAVDPLALLGPDGQVLAQPGDSVVLGGGGPPTGASPAPAQDPCGLGSVFLVASVVEVNGKAVNIGEGSLRLVTHAASAAGSCPSGYLPSLMLVMSGGHLRLRTTDGTDLDATWPPGFTARSGNRITVVDPAGRVVATQGEEAGNLRGEVRTGSVEICGAGSRSYP